MNKEPTDFEVFEEVNLLSLKFSEIKNERVLQNVQNTDADFED